MGYIYVIKNIINCKIYVGQTKRYINIRWREHKNLVGVGPKLKNSYNKYGFENHTKDLKGNNYGY